MYLNCMAVDPGLEVESADFVLVSASDLFRKSAVSPRAHADAPISFLDLGNMQ